MADTSHTLEVGMTNADDSSKPSRPIWRNPFFWFVIATGLGYGGVRNFIPATFPYFHHDMAATLAQMGQSQLLFYLSNLAFAIVGGPVLVWLGLKRAAIASFGLLALSLVLAGAATHFDLVLVSATFAGLAVCALVVIISSAVSSHFHRMRQSVFFLTGLSDASGSMLGPAALGWWFVHAGRWNLSWRSGYFLAAGVIGTLVVWGLLMPSASLRGDQIPNRSRWTGLRNMRDVVRNSAFYTAVLLCFFHGAAQAGMIAFVGQLFIKKLHIDAAQAAYLLSAESIGILSGRALFSGLTAIWKIPELVVIAVCAAVETTAFLATILASSYAAGFVLFISAGIFMAAIGPSLNSYLGGRLADRVATAFALFAGLGNVGAALGPFLIGTFATAHGIEQSILLVPMFSGSLGVIAVVQYLRERAKPAVTAHSATATAMRRVTPAEDSGS